MKVKYSLGLYFSFFLSLYFFFFAARWRKQREAFAKSLRGNKSVKSVLQVRRWHSGDKKKNKTTEMMKDQTPETGASEPPVCGRVAELPG